MRILIASLFVLAVLVVVVAGQTPQAKEDDKFAEINKYLSDLETSGFSGAVLLAKDGKPLLRKGIGERDRASHDRIDPDTGFDIGSITKVFTSAAIFRLEQDGKLRLTDPLS